MDRETVIQLAKDCGYWSGQTVEMNAVGIEAFATAIEQRTLEMAAQEWDDLNAPPAYGVVETSSYEVATIDCAAAIRALGEKA